MWGNTAAWWRCSRRAAFSLRADTDAGPPTNTVLAAPDGSWCEVRETTTDGAHQVWEAGPHALWRITEERHTLWHALGEPGWDRFGLTATAAQQWAWLDSPDGKHTWNLTT